MIKLSRLALALVIILPLTGCGGEGEEDSVFNLWEDDSNGELLDLRGYEADNTAVVRKNILGDSVKCTCDIDFIGDEEEGTYVISACEADNENNDEACRDEMEVSVEYEVDDRDMSTINHTSTRVRYWTIYDDDDD